jgi:ABC-2 type transport system permease protein
LKVDEVPILPWRGAVVRTIASNEFRLLLADGRLVTAAAILVTLFAVSFFAGWHNYEATSERNQLAERQDRIRWLNQGVKGPHEAADQGLMVFRPLPALSAFDPGILPFTGSEAVLGGHHEEIFTAKDAEGFHSLHRLGTLSAAATLERFVPLVVILLLYSAIAGERERGTLRQVLSLGVSGPELIAGKLLGAILPLVCILTTLAFFAAWKLTGGWREEEPLTRVAALGVFYLVYFAVVGALVMTVSIRAGTAKQALAILLGCWCFACVLAPALAADIAQWISPSPTSLDYAVAVLDADRKLPTVEERRAELRSRLLKQYKVASLRDLPVDPIGIELLEEARDVQPIFHRVVGGVYDAYERQNRIYQTASILSPMLAIQSISMTLCGSDWAAYRDFTEAAERYRQSVVRILNEAIAYNPDYRQSAVFPGTDIIVSQAGPELWRRAPEFHFAPAGFWVVANRARGAIVMLSAWIVFASILLWRSVARLKVD